MMKLLHGFRYHSHTNSGSIASIYIYVYVWSHAGFVSSTIASPFRLHFDPCKSSVCHDSGVAGVAKDDGMLHNLAASAGPFRYKGGL